jgi:hypothetical protein
VVKPLLPTLEGIVRNEVEGAAGHGLGYLQTVPCVPDFSQIYWPSEPAEEGGVECFLWSMDSRLHYLFVRAFVLLNTLAQLADSEDEDVVSSSVTVQRPDVLAQSIVSVIYELGRKDHIVNVYFVRDQFDNGLYRMVLDTHKDSLNYMHLFPEVRNGGMLEFAH